jgi:membrane fusion protein, multidrug efflux system
MHWFTERRYYLRWAISQPIQHPVPHQPTEISRSSTLDLLLHGRDGSPTPPLHRKRRTWSLLAVLLVLGIAVWIGLRVYKAMRAANAKPQTAPSIPVIAAVAHRGDIPVYFTGLGAVTPIYTVTIKTRVDGEIIRVGYTEGQKVQKGQPLVDIDPRPYEAQLMQAQGQLIKDQAALDNARIDLKRYQELIVKNAVAEQIYATQKATVVQLEGAVKTDEGNIASAKLNIAYCHITASITGRVGLRLVDPGNLVYAAAETPLVVITEIEPISVIFTLPEQQIPTVLSRVRGGERLRVDALDRDSKGVIARGELTTLDNQIDQTTGTLRFRATFANKGESLFPNQFVNARLLVETRQNVTLVPNAAIQRNGTATFVYVLQPDKTVRVPNVAIGATDAEESEIKSGIAANDVVIVQGVDKLQEGTHVQAQIQQFGSRSGQTDSAVNDMAMGRRGQSASPPAGVGGAYGDSAPRSPSQSRTKPKR